MDVDDLYKLLEYEEDMITEWFKKRSRKRRIKQLINDNVQIGDFTGSSGKNLKYYVDCRPLIANSSTRITLIKGIYDILSDITGKGHNTIFAGPQTSGALLATDLALFRSSNAIIINLNKNEIIYPYALDISDKKIILIDDVITTGSTLEKCIELLKDYKIMRIVSLVNRGNLDNIKGIEIVSILGERDINWRKS